MQFAPFYIYNFYKTQEKGKKVKKKKNIIDQQADVQCAHKFNTNIILDESSENKLFETKRFLVKKKKKCESDVICCRF